MEHRPLDAGKIHDYQMSRTAQQGVSKLSGHLDAVRPVVAHQKWQKCSSADQMGKSCSYSKSTGIISSDAQHLIMLTSSDDRRSGRSLLTAPVGRLFARLVGPRISDIRTMPSVHIESYLGRGPCAIFSRVGRNHQCIWSTGTAALAQMSRIGVHNSTDRRAVTADYST